MFKVVLDIKTKANEIEIKNKKIEEQLRLEEEKKANYFIDLEKYLNNVSSQYGENIGISFYDTKTGENISINGDRYFIAASTTKVPLNMILYDKAYSGNISLDNRMNYSSVYFEDGTGIIQQNIQDSYILSDLSKYSIVYSDNIATNMIYGYLGGYNSVMREFDNYLGYQGCHSNNEITPNQATTYLKILYENKNENPYYNDLIKNLKNTTFKIRMEENLTNGIVAHKIGTYGSYVNDIGIVYGKNPFILSIYTSGIGNSESLITEITDYIYNEQNSKYPF